MRARLVLALAAGALAVGSTVAVAAPPEVVTVTRDNGGVQVRTGIPGQPLVGVSADNNGVCAGFSKQVPQCLPPVSTG